jgi:Domain of Unknown Function (DUF1080)
MQYNNITRRTALGAMAGAALLQGAAGDWVSLFDGKTLNGWKPNESAASWKVTDGCLTANGPRSHLFYAGPVRGAQFKNFELEAEVMLWPGSNSGIYFHTAHQESGWPAKGFEVQLDNTHKGEGTYREHKKTGSLYGVRNQYKSFVRDNEWFRVNILVRAKTIQVRVNEMLLVDYTEPDQPMVAAGDGRGRALSSGTFALQGHDPASKAAFRSVRVRPLADDVTVPGAQPAATDATARQLLDLSAQNYPVVDYHAHLKGGLTVDQVLAKSRATGIYYGLAVNCGLNFPVQSDAALREFVDSLKGAPLFTALQGEGREWVTYVTPAAVGLFDYVFTDSMTWTDNRGKRMRLWMPDEVGAIADPQEFMDTLVARAVGIFEKEPIDIYANPTYLPATLSGNYDALWTEPRMLRVIRAAKANDVAIELNGNRLPSEKFVRLAKAEGIKFAFATNNTGADDLKRIEYGLEMVTACKLTWQDFWTPRPVGERAVDRKPKALKAG